MAKFDSNGNPLNVIGIGSNAIEGGMGVGTDANDNVYLVGYFLGETLTIGSVTLNNQDIGGTSDFFIAKFNSDGEPQWAKSAGSAVGDGANRIAVDAEGNSYVTGYYGGNEMFFETITLYTYGAMDIFTVKYDSDGNELWAIKAGGTSYEQGMDIAADEDGNSYVVGYFSSPTVTFRFTDITNSGINDIFVVKYDQNGVEQWVKSIGGDSYEGGTGISSSNLGVYITGYFASPVLDFGNGIQTTNNGDQSVFAAGFNHDGYATWGDSVGGSNAETCKAVSSDQLGRVYFAGNFASDSVTIGGEEFTNGNPGTDDVFVAKQSNSLGLSEVSHAQVAVYPNPSSGVFHLKSDTQIKSVEVIGMTGQTVFKSIVNSDHFEIKLQNRPAGVYVLKIQTENGVKTQKLIIRH